MINHTHEEEKHQFELDIEYFSEENKHFVLISSAVSVGLAETTHIPVLTCSFFLINQRKEREREKEREGGGERDRERGRQR